MACLTNVAIFSNPIDPPRSSVATLLCVSLVCMMVICLVAVSANTNCCGATTTSTRTYDALEQLMRSEPIDFIGVDYAVDNRAMEERIFPLAQERGIGVLVYLPFGRTRLWEAVEGKQVPEWAAEYDIATWGQFFLKFAVSHPAVTAATPATSNPRHMIDNLGAAMGRLPDEAARQRMIGHIESLG